MTHNIITSNILLIIQLSTSLYLHLFLFIFGECENPGLTNFTKFINDKIYEIKEGLKKLTMKFGGLNTSQRVARLDNKNKPTYDSKSFQL